MADGDSNEDAPSGSTSPMEPELPQDDYKRSMEETVSKLTESISDAESTLRRVNTDNRSISELSKTDA